MPSHIIEKVNKMGIVDGNMALNFLDQWKTEYVFDEEGNLEVNSREDQMNNTEENFPGVEIGTMDESWTRFSTRECGWNGRESQNNADTPFIEPGYVVNKLEDRINPGQPDQHVEPNQYEMEEELNEIIAEDVNVEDTNDIEIKSDPNDAHNNEMEAEIKKEATIDEAPIEQVHNEQEHVLRLSGRMQQPYVRYKEHIQTTVDVKELDVLVKRQE